MPVANMASVAVANAAVVADTTNVVSVKHESVHSTASANTTDVV